VIFECADACDDVEWSVEEFELTIREAAERPGSATLRRQPHIETNSSPLKRKNTNFNFI
jgi:hypothetical protein